MSELIVGERDGSWATAMAQRLAGSDVRIRQTRNLAAVEQELRVAPASCLVVALDVSTREEVIQFLSLLERRFPAVLAVAVAPRSMRGYEWLAREAGAVHFTTSPRQLGPVARLALRHLSRAPKSPRSLTERIWATLPWSEPTTNPKR